MNAIFTTLWTTTHVASNQNHRARANDHSTMYWRDSKPIAHSASKYCTWRSRARPHCDLIGHVHIPDMSTTRYPRLNNNWGEPERAPHKRYSHARILYYILLYIIYYGTSVTRNYILSDLYGHKRETFYCAFSCLGHGPYIRRSDLANCKFTLVLVLIKQATVHVPRRRRESDRGRARYQLNSARTSY